MHYEVYTGYTNASAEGVRGLIYNLSYEINSTAASGFQKQFCNRVTQYLNKSCDTMSVTTVQSVAVMPPAPAPTPALTSLSTGAIIGIVCGCVAACLLICCLITMLLYALMAVILKQFGIKL